MRKNHCYKFYAKYLVGKCRVSSGLSPPLYIDRHLSLPSLCEASHNDGWGEGFEQREIKTADGGLYVSFWQSDGDFFIKTEQELKNQPEQSFGMQMGGM